jgi:two-component system, cell cycle response regulator CpdR
MAVCRCPFGLDRRYSFAPATLPASMFYIAWTLPQDRMRDPGVQPAMTRQFTIVFAEDDSAVRAVIMEALAARGFRVFPAADGHEALRLLAAERADLLLADIVMPGLDGVQLARKAKQMHPAIKVLFTTGYAQRAAEREALRHGRVLFKPIRHPELMREVEAVLAGYA